MIKETLDKIINARSNVTLESEEMMDVKKYMFKEILKSRISDKKIIKSDSDYVNSLISLDPHKADIDKISKEGLKVLCIIFAGYISVVSSKQCEEDFTFKKPVFENEVTFDKDGFNLSKKMYIKYKAQTYNFKTEQTIEMIRQQFQMLDFFGENFFAFKLTNNKSLLLVNSFFRLYFDNFQERKAFMDLDLSKYTDIPSFLSIAPNGVVFTESRRYKYEIHELDYDSVEYINSLCK